MFYAYQGAFRRDVEYSSDELADLDLDRMTVGHVDEELQFYRNWNTIIELTFLFQMLVTFFTEYLPIDHIHPIRDLELIAEKYFHGQFWLDILAILPLTSIIKFKHSRILFFVKAVRLVQTKEMLEYKIFMK